jgi:hypothetical protein
MLGLSTGLPFDGVSALFSASPLVIPAHLAHLLYLSGVRLPACCELRCHLFPTHTGCGPSICIYPTVAMTAGGKSTCLATGR